MISKFKMSNEGKFQLTSKIEFMPSKDTTSNVYYQR